MPTIKEETKDLDKVEPIDYGVIAKPHTPVYKMHRYFARRPYTVFNELIRHYSNPGSIILDPMCGGGVTIIEGLRLRRKVIGVDLNPIAIFITKMEAIDIDLNKFKKVFWELSEKVKNEIESFYLTKCPKCGREVSADWFEWSNVVECPKCHKEIVFAQTKKLRAGTYECPYCGEPVKSLKAQRLKDTMVRLKLKCDCGFKDEKKPDDYDLSKYRWIEDSFDRIVREQGLWYPKDEIFVGEKTNELLTNRYRYFYELFTKRNLLALAILLKGIEDIVNLNIKELMLLTFSSTIDYSTKMSRVVQGAGREITMHAFWTPRLPCENNVWFSFFKRYTAATKGKEQSRREIGGYYKTVESFKDLRGNNATCWLSAKSATDLREIPDESIDVIITDPPYGGNVNYTELSDLWAIWLRNVLGADGVIDSREEAIVNKYQGKGIKEYRELMYQIFKECYRVLKPNRYVVMTFHNREFKVWSAIHLAAHDAGFIWSEKDGMIYQPPIREYFTPGMLHGRAAGAMQGDFVLSYRKAEGAPKEKWIDDAEIGNKIRDIAGQAIEYHGGAKLSTVYTRLMPFLLNSGLLEKMTDRDLEPYLSKYFIRKDDKWYFPEAKADKVAEHRLEYYAPVEARVESIVRRFLYAKHQATMDEILNAVYSRLINSNAAEYEEIVHALNRICVKVAGDRGKAVYQLKEERDKELLFEFARKKTEEFRYSEESDHDIIIEQVVRIGKNKGYESHIGLTEQKKDKNFRDLSLPMGSNVQFGLNQIAFNRIREIDLLWIKGVSIMAAFEVEKSTSIDSGITRFRELFAATPTLNIPAYIIIPDKREKETLNKIGSLANRREGVTERIKYILFSDILGKKDVNIATVAKGVS